MLAHAMEPFSTQPPTEQADTHAALCARGLDRATEMMHERFPVIHCVACNESVAPMTKCTAPEARGRYHLPN
jgi:hypothetical protein